MKVKTKSLRIYALILLAFAVIDRWGFDDKAAFNAEWTGAIILIAIAAAFRSDGE